MCVYVGVPAGHEAHALQAEEVAPGWLKLTASQPKHTTGLFILILIYVYVSTSMCVYIYIYIHIEREI